MSGSAARVIADGGWERLSPGTVVGDRFEVVRLRGEGGMGAVYEAEDRVIGRRVAVKLLTARDEKAAARFREEARAASLISSRHVAAVHDFGEDPEHGLYMVMELLAGHALDEVLAAQGSLPAPQAAAIGADVAEALSAAHAKKVVHRDLKPGNVLVLDEGGLKVLDFGIARVTETEAGRLGPDLTGEGTIIGTPTYISPEAVAGKRVGPAADLYSLGVMLFEMVTGRPPFVDDVPSALCTQHLRQPAPPIGAVSPVLELPEGFAELVEALLEKDPDRRPRSALEVAEALRAMSDGEGPLRLAGEAVGAGAPTAYIPPDRLPSRRRPWPFLVGGAVVLAGAIVGLAFGLAGDDPDESSSAVTQLPAETQPPPEEETSPPPGVDPPPVPAAPETVELAVSVTPSSATVRLDGEETALPATLPNDGSEHELEIVARGYRTERRTFTADRDREIEVVLRRRHGRGRRRLPAGFQEW
jgi:serine/threonine-protein kinase